MNMINYLLGWSFIYYINHTKNINPQSMRPFFSLIHSSISILINFSIRYRNSQLDYTHTNWENNSLMFSLGYFVVDSIPAIITKKYIYLVHHILSILGLGTNLYSQKNSGFMVLFLLLGELTNPLLNTINIIKNTKYKKLCSCLIIVHRLIFMFIRLIYIPYIYLRNYKKITSDEGSYTPVYHSISCLLTLGSLYWFIKQMINIKSDIKPLLQNMA